MVIFANVRSQNTDFYVLDLGNIYTKVAVKTNCINY